MIDNRKNYKIVLDVETANSIDCPLVYDIGGVVTDKSGNIYESFSFVIREIFVEEKELMNTAYYAEKIPSYYRSIWSNEREVVSFFKARAYILNLMKYYHITEVAAYNAHFDSRALNMTLRWLTKSKSRFFFPYDTQFVCIWNMACQTICQRKTYRNFCEENNFTNNHAKNYSTTAETVYRFLLLDPTYTEEHKGFDDVLIELEIMKECYKSHKAMPKGRGIRRNCWMDVKRTI